MNEALAQWEASHNYSKPADVESAMTILEEAGFNAENWVCLTSYYQVWWSKNDNRCVLYNSDTLKVDYPETYSPFELIGEEAGYYVYNANHMKARNFDLQLGSAENATAQTGFVSSRESISKTVLNNASDNTHENENLAVMDALTSGSTANTKVVSSITGSNNANVVVYATKEKVSSSTAKAYASLQVASVGKYGDPAPVFTDSTNKQVLAENFYYLTVVTETGASEVEIKSAQKAAGQYVYTLFDKITNNEIPSDATIVLDAGTVLNCSDMEWSPAKIFTGYFGTTDANNPVIIDGARITRNTVKEQLVNFNSLEPHDGQYSYYAACGFFGAVYGDTTIENVTFRNLKIEDPASDMESLNITDGKDGCRRNSVGVIGAIIPGPDGNTSNVVAANVNLINITVEGSCSIKGIACAGGLVGWIGRGFAGTLSGNVNFTNCHISASVQGGTSSKICYGDYGVVGGFVGFTVSNNNTEIKFTNCTFDGYADGLTSIAAVVGDNNGSVKYIFDGTNHFENAKLGTKTVGIMYNPETCNTSALRRTLADGLTYPNAVFAIMSRVQNTCHLTFNGTTTYVEGFPTYTYNQTNHGVQAGWVYDLTNK